MNCMITNGACGHVTDRARDLTVRLVTAKNVRRRKARQDVDMVLEWFSAAPNRAIATIIVSRLSSVEK